MPSSVSSRTKTQFFQGLPTVNVLAEVMRTAVGPSSSVPGAASARGRADRGGDLTFVPPFTSYRTECYKPRAHRNEGNNVSEIDQSTSLSRRRMMQAALAGGAGALPPPALAPDR